MDRSQFSPKGAASAHPSAPYNTLPRLPAGLRSPDRPTDNGNQLEDDDDEMPLGAGLGGPLPRRNHTISSGTAGTKARRLAQHFEQPVPSTSSHSGSHSPQASKHGAESAESGAFQSHNVASPGRNSLREIAGAENEHDEWERAILDERKSAADDLASLPFSSGISSNAPVRRHQSLNHHLGRSMASRLAHTGKSQTPSHSPSSSRQHNTLSGALSPSSFGTRLQDAFNMGEDGSSLTVDAETTFGAASSSPLTQTSFSSTPWSSNGRLSPAARIGASSTSPSFIRRMDDFNERRTPSPLANTVENGVTSGDLRSGDLMSMHALFKDMQLGSGTAHGEPGLADSNMPRRVSNADTASPVSTQSKKLPSLITSPEALARAAKQHTRQGSDYDVHAGLMGSLTASPNAHFHTSNNQNRSRVHGSGHSRIQSTDAVLALGSSGAAHHQGPTGPPPASQGDTFAPHTAAPISNWSDKDRIAGWRSHENANADQGGHPPTRPPGVQGEAVSAHPGLEPAPDRFGHSAVGHASSQATSRGAIPSQWGLGLSPAVERDNRDQITYALSVALAEQRQKTAMLEAAYRASTGMAPPTGFDAGEQYVNHQQHHRNLSQGSQHMGSPYFPNLADNLGFVGPAVNQASPQLGREASSQMQGPMPPLQMHAKQQAAPLAPQQAARSSISKPGLAAKVADFAARLGLNPVSYELSPPTSSRFVVIKSFTEEDVHRSIRHGIWASTDKGNQRLDRIYKDCEREAAEKKHDDAGVFLFFSVNGSGHFCGVARMTSAVDFDTSSDVWAQEGKWKGTFQVKHIFVKDVPNRDLRHIPHPNKMEKKSVTQSRDTQELPRETGLEMLKIIHSYPAKTSLLSALCAEDEGGQAEKGEGAMGEGRQTQGSPGLGLNASFARRPNGRFSAGPQLAASSPPSFSPPMPPGNRFPSPGPGNGLMASQMAFRNAYQGANGRLGGEPLAYPAGFGPRQMYGGPVAPAPPNPQQPILRFGSGPHAEASVQQDPAIALHQQQHPPGYM